MSLRDWLMGQSPKRPQPPALDAFDRAVEAAATMRRMRDGAAQLRVEAVIAAASDTAAAAAELPDAGPVATAAAAVSEAVEHYRTVVRAPWVADVDNTKVRKVRDERRADSCGCWPRYVGGCYCGTGVRR